MTSKSFLVVVNRIAIRFSFAQMLTFFEVSNAVNEGRKVSTSRTNQKKLFSIFIMAVSVAGSKYDPAKFAGLLLD